MNHGGLMNDRAYSIDALTKQDLQRINPMNWMEHTTRGKVWDVSHAAHDNAQVTMGATALMVANATYVAEVVDALAPMIESHGALLPAIIKKWNGANPLDHVAPSTRGILADMAGGNATNRVSSLATGILDNLNPLMVTLVNKHGNLAATELVRILRRVNDAATQGNWDGTAKALVPLADDTEAVDAFDRLVEFTLYCAPTNVACVMDWCTATSVVEKFVVEDDRAGTGTWTVKFTTNGAEVIDALSKMAREHQIDVHMNMLAGG